MHGVRLRQEMCGYQGNVSVGFALGATIYFGHQVEMDFFVLKNKTKQKIKLMLHLELKYNVQCGWILILRFS